ncbi:MAG TPA: polyphosphate kinase 2 family protein [Arsenicitalea sp.]|jgi:PPK2 family polyphosphate:nucleotide phosphotransferase|nr:polyphosphate kinase 2 family protein [Arsenicitalea sp.]
MLSGLTKRYRVRKGHSFRLADIDPADTAGLRLEKDEAQALIAAGVEQLNRLQGRLYAEHQWALLIILQGMDAAGKDGVVKHVMSGVNPLGCSAHSFKAPSQQELDHDYLWRHHVVMPRRGHIGIFNRSYYEEVLVVRVHKELLAAEGLPPKLLHEDIWNQRFEEISAYERYLARNGIIPLKFFLHLSKEEQRRRLLERADDPEKQWKFSMSDLADRQLWDQYMAAYEDTIRQTASKQAPWHVVPADNKWFTRLVVASTIVETLEKLDPKPPKIDPEAKAELTKAREALLAEPSTAAAIPPRVLTAQHGPGRKNPPGNG